MDKIYLDHNATTPVAPEVLHIITSVLRDQMGNPSSVHSMGRSARVLIDEAREQVASLIGASPSEIVFTSGGTEANNLALLGVALGARTGHIVTSQVEHPSVLNPCRQLESLGFVVDRLRVDELGRIDLQALENCLTASTLLVSLQHANSETGVLQDIEKIGEIVRKKGVLFHTDAVQSAGKIPLQVQDVPVDMLSLSAHKLNGAKGVGALYLKKGSPDLFSPLSGGSQEKKRRGGTENVAGIAGFGKACELAQKHLVSQKCLSSLRDHFYQLVSDLIPGVEIFGDLENRLPNTLNLGFEGVEGDTLLIGLDMAGIAVSTGSACSSGSGLPSPVLTAMGIPYDKINSSIRFSFGWSNTTAEIEKAAKILAETVSLNRTGTFADMSNKKLMKSL
ncbi:MAG: cysteine desulfurase [Nitrospina sp.]|nr:cysteine desulfurase [Nitrospina sp.]MBT5763957.1 cysteine desulfurase [Nitrospina sp.]MBT6597295.1 cysteine desulfurase [Nitrospina sp.]